MNEMTASSRPSRVRLRQAAVLAVFLSGLGVAPWTALSRPAVGQAPADEQQAAKPDRQSAAYTLPTRRQSYFKLDAQGTLELQDKLPYRAEETYRFQRIIQPVETAIVIMDPWVDMASEHLNKYFARIVESRILPLVRHALELGHPIIVLTNSPDKVDYNTQVHPELTARAAKGEITILYHQAMDDKGFASYLRTRGIDSLIYTGFASNMCVIGRRMGMIPMIHHGFRLFFVPEASAAVEYPDTWQDQSIHRATTQIISQWIAEIVEYDDLLGVGGEPGSEASPKAPERVVKPEG